jgi:putative transposase
MTPRALQIDLDVTPYYHCVSRCVRRAFLCGEDRYTKKNFDHRKSWVVERLELLAEVFAIDICAYAVMSNHVHLVLRVVPERVAEWTDEQVAARVSRVFKSVFAGFDDMPAASRRETVAKWRERLASLSWFMRCLNEWLARKANEEDDCTGRFWEGRFKCQVLLNEGALLACMSYVDLNPVRAGMATSLEGSAFTSIGARLAAGAEAKEKSRPQPITPPGLAPLRGERKRRAELERLSISLTDYVDLLDWTGRAARDDKAGVITGPPPELLVEAELNSAAWLETVQQWSARLWDVVGARDEVERAAAARGKAWLKGLSWAGEMYGAK